MRVCSAAYFIATFSLMCTSVLFMACGFVCYMVYFCTTSQKAQYNSRQAVTAFIIMAGGCFITNVSL